MVWDPTTDPCDYITINGVKSPGVAEVIGASTPRKWEEREPYGFGGATLIYRGQLLSTFTVELTFTTSQHFLEWETWKPLVAKPPLRTQPKALNIVHPQLTDVGIGSVVVEDRSQLTQVDDGVWVVTIKFKEFRKIAIALAKPDAAAPPQPVDPVDTTIDDLASQVESLL